MRLIGTTVRIDSRDNSDNGREGEILATKISLEGEMYIFLRLGHSIVRHHYKNVQFLDKDVDRWHQEKREKLDGRE
jgi:hypothetical protein